MPRVLDPFRFLLIAVAGWMPIRRSLHELKLRRLCTGANLPQEGTHIEADPRYRDHSGFEVVFVE